MYVLTACQTRFGPFIHRGQVASAPEQSGSLALRCPAHRHDSFYIMLLLQYN
jgi:hypothetical protein